MITLITNRKLVEANRYFEVIEKAIKGGVSRLILREKDLPILEYLEVTKKLYKLKDKYEFELILNTPLEKNRLKEFCDGFHFTEESLIKCKETKDKVFFKGVSIHKEELVSSVGDFDYMIYSNIFETDCKKGLKGKGIEALKEVVKNSSIPVWALGGITVKNVSQLKNTQIAGICVMSGIMSSKDPEKDVYEYLNKIV